MTDTIEYFQQSKSHPKYHLHGIVHDQSAYLRQLQAARANGAWSNLLSALKGAVLAALWMAKCHNVVADILEKEVCGIAEISKMLPVLDKPRQRQQLKKKIERIEREHPHVIVSDEDEANDSKKKRARDNSQDATKRKRSRKVDMLRRDLRSLEATLENHQ
jgi:hypothetical protein